MSAFNFSVTAFQFHKQRIHVILEFYFERNAITQFFDTIVRKINKTCIVDGPWF